MAGAYSYLPLGLKVLNNIADIVREEMDVIGADELLMPMLHPKDSWVRTGAWENVDVLFKLESRTGREYALGQSEEEIVTPLVMSKVQTYRDLPIHVYQIGWKFRDELRSKSGLMRGREFLMKDMYSFHEDQADFDRFYEITKNAYLRVYERLGLVAKVTEASGGAFTEKISYEFMVLTDAGEDDILYCDQCEFCINVEIADLQSGNNCPKCMQGTLAQARASEVGNVFDLGQKYGRDFGLSFIDRSDSKQFPIMGCYGLGISRLMGVIVEKFHDDRGIIWPEIIAPARVHLVNIGNSDEVIDHANDIYTRLCQQGISVLWDERETTAGIKLKDADLIGIPYRVVVSSRTLEEGKVEVKPRTDEPALITIDELISRLNSTPA
ncbi:MAG: His/Gly/Thr/Pro-type tRNA ligase C-terminal domain-containing protein [Thermomicrobiales bacterium]|nr:His/Gly/Thr/Pro-type tRNA ligase C-terminal domain-containing protein [Thermomicrobiales bacterium]MCO5218898.1 His/Gly/Thr/Pro-type tRNA ligase C-terminal domain-containing protein [Thermomicrobiales bacterium]MCO5225162.1 His/Gly/Thr/Pro-type tRNA ligase C-terminal domain-containing protein [Thermomicrobiales bacterium]MCO5229215.1 His/Gly/Thr/Pro-type tRNA ligase C-terminal domain-containing protein [Thermomicrobiales bacterium]